ncbi:LptF/LptG family permease [Lacibacter sediminis]|uniref:LptF/LptG family permease n=1 Tax=Lacibacter sediminis TaxID=2760713 RepID=A0A7G5XI93_9BACT|nr:LptF/LptG family permease [Lacibacter sediminis]QNA45196.1 LptF/LptG family permease [Lacibacter sediminis]
MFKKLDKLIIKAFIGPFLATFFIAVFILVVQFFWLYIDDFVGKGIDTFTLIQFIGYVSTTLVPLALPLGILLSSIMTFGNLGESFELVAIKSAGIPLIRFMRPVLIVSMLLGVVAFAFANYVIPVAELKMRTLLYDIRVAKPAFDIKEGVFYKKLDGYTIKVGRKENDSIIHNVVIYEHNYSLQDNIILAEKGTMTISGDQRFLSFNLQNGWRYQEKGSAGTTETEYYRLGFKEYKKVFDLSSFKLTKTADSTFKTYYKMLSLQQLTTVADSLEGVIAKLGQKSRRDIRPMFPLQSVPDSVWKNNKAVAKKVKNFRELIPDSLKRNVYSNAVTKISGAKSSIDFLSYEFVDQQKQLRLHRIEQHRKFTLSFACVVLFLIGAPLGSIIRKGGLGLPLVISVFFFIVFHIVNTTGEKMVREDTMKPGAGMWMSTVVLIPIGIFLTWKAMKDSNLFNAEFYYRTMRRIGLSRWLKRKE